MAEHRFREFLRGHLGGDEDLDRDFIQQAVDDAGLPDPESWDVLKAYVEDQPYASAEAIAAADYVWRQYKLEH